MEKISLNRVLTFWLMLLWLSGCTENPFDSDKISTPGRVILGKVELNDHSNPEGAYIWLEEFDLGTFSDKNGSFQIMLPPPQSQTGDGVTGAFKLYFFITNYQLDSSLVVIHHGELQYLHGDINDKGELREPKYLVKLLNIETEVDPSMVRSDYNGLITIELALQARNDEVVIQYPDRSQGPLSIIFIEKADTDETYSKIFDINGRALNASLFIDTISTKPKVWITTFQFDSGLLPKGKYKIIPYFLIEQKSVPSELMNNLGANVLRPDPDFLNMPMKRSGGDFEIRDADK